jgi:hypothetical protein
MSLDQEIYNTAIAEGFSPTSAKIIVAQARLESANYGSPVFKNNNNMYGMKFVGQSLATRGTLAPPNERSESCRNGGACKNSDYYSKYQTPSDSAKDVIQRLYKKTRNGIGFNELKNVKDANEFATKLKTRNYFGFHDINTPEGKAEANKYALGLNARLVLVSISEVIDNSVQFYQDNKKKVNYIVLGIVLIGVTTLSYWYYKKRK